MKCPVCSVDMKQTPAGSGGVEIEQCPDCGGSWFDSGELDSVDDSVWTNVELVDFITRSDDTRQLSCPRDDSAMEVISPTELPELRLDRCTSCLGFWLDAGELEQVREVSLAVDSDRLDHTHLLQRPDDWTWLRWNLYRLSHFVGGWNP